MHKSKSIYNAFYGGIATLVGNGVAAVVKTNIDTEQDFPQISVCLGSDTKEDYTKSDFKHSLTLYTDIYVISDVNDVDDEMLDIRELIEIKVLSFEDLDLDYVFNVEFLDQGEPDYNGEGTDYGSRTRLSWLVEYTTPHDNPSN